MSAATFLGKPGSSIHRGLRDLQNPDAISANNSGRSLYSLPVNNGQEQFAYGVYGANNIPVHGVELESGKAPLGDTMTGVPADRA